MVLKSRPSANVTVSSSSNNTDVTTGSSAVFTSSNWNTPAAITVSAAEDADDADDSATLTHTVTSTDPDFNGTPLIDVTVSVHDDDAVGLAVSSHRVVVSEGSTATYTAKLTKAPSGNVTVNLSPGATNDDSLTFSPSSLTFSSTNWNSAQTVTVTAAQDADGADGTTHILHAGASTNPDTSWRGALNVYNPDGSAHTRVAAVEDDDETPDVTRSPASLTVVEGSTATYTVKLTLKPLGNVDIAVANRGGSTDDADLTASPATLTFTPSNYGTAQTVTVSAAEDGDSTNGTAVITHTATSSHQDYDGLAVRNLTATESDNDSNVAIVFGGVPDRTWYRNESIGTVTLPAATGGNGTLTYTLTPALPAGVTLDADARTLTGTPTATAAAATYTWSATDEDDDTLSRTFTIEVKTLNTAPTSANVTLAVSHDNRTAIPLSKFPFSDKDGDTLHGVKIIDLPRASAGTLGLVKTGIYAGADTVLCVGTITPIVAGQEILEAVSTVLYFCPGGGFTHTTFRFQVIDSQGWASDKTWTATLVGPPGQVTGLKAEAGNGYVRLSWTDPKNPAITGYEYRQKSGSNYGAWTAMTGTGATTTSYSVSDLANATAYTFQVRARTAGGPGPVPSAAVTATPTSAVVPAKPTGLQGVNLGFNTTNTWVRVRLLWTTRRTRRSPGTRRSGSSRARKAPGSTPSVSRTTTCRAAVRPRPRRWWSPDPTRPRTRSGCARSIPRGTARGRIRSASSSTAMGRHR